MCGWYWAAGEDSGDWSLPWGGGQSLPLGRRQAHREEYSHVHEAWHHLRVSNLWHLPLHERVQWRWSYCGMSVMQFNCANCSALLLDEGQREGDWAECCFPRGGCCCATALPGASAGPRRHEAAEGSQTQGRSPPAEGQGALQRTVKTVPGSWHTSLLRPARPRLRPRGVAGVWRQHNSRRDPVCSRSAADWNRIARGVGSEAFSVLSAWAPLCQCGEQRSRERESGNPVKHSSPTEFWKYSATCSGVSSDHQAGSFSSEIVQFVWAFIERKIFVCVPCFLLWFLINKSWSLFPQQPFHRCLERAASFKAETLHLVIPVSSTSGIPKQR